MRRVSAVTAGLALAALLGAWGGQQLTPGPATTTTEQPAPKAKTYQQVQLLTAATKKASTARSSYKVDQKVDLPDQPLVTTQCAVRATADSFGADCGMAMSMM